MSVVGFVEEAFVSVPEELAQLKVLPHPFLEATQKKSETQPPDGADLLHNKRPDLPATAARSLVASRPPDTGQWDRI